MEQLVAFGQVIVIDLVLAGDNAIVVGLAAASLPKELRAKAIFYGIAAATVARILFAVVTSQLLAIVGLTLAGGILLLWVCWKFWRELEHQRVQRRNASGGVEHEHVVPGMAEPKTMRQAMIQIVIADITMALDNVLAVAGASQGSHGEPHLWVLIAGLAISVALMGAAATFIAKLLNKYHWISYLGLVIILYVALEMIWKGASQVLAVTAGLT